jgi:ATP-dependent Clp protease protease subunit
MNKIWAPTNAYVPMVIHREGNSERAMDIYSRLLDERIVYMYGPVEPNMANSIKAQLTLLEAEDPKADITMYIDSPGGEVATGMGIYDTMNYITCDVRTVCVGMAASMGSVILLNGTKGKRYALPNSEIMIHQPSSGCQGKITDMEKSFEHSKRLKERLHRIYTEKTGQPIEKIREDMEHDHWLWADEAAEYGIIDYVITNHEEVLV